MKINTLMRILKNDDVHTADKLQEPIFNGLTSLGRCAMHEGKLLLWHQDEKQS